MLSFTSRFGSAKGMVAVPNLSNKTPTQAIADLTASGLVAGSTSSTNTSTSSSGNLIFSQSIPAGTLVDYDTAVGYSYYVYVAPSGGGNPPPVITYGALEQNGTSPSTIPTSCAGSAPSAYCVGPYTQNWKRKVFVDGTWNGSYDYPAGTYYPEVCSYVDGLCGYPPPAVTCVTSQINYSSWSTCSGSPATQFRTYYNYTQCSNGSNTTTEVVETRDCCLTSSVNVSSSYGPCTPNASCSQFTKCKTTTTVTLCGSTSTTVTTEGPCVSCTPTAYC